MFFSDSSRLLGSWNMHTELLVLLIDDGRQELDVSK
jgi:hypothetical protein